MAKLNNDRTLAPSAGEGWDAWGAACGFTSWAKAAEAIGISVAQMVTIRKKTPRKTIRLAMDAVLAGQRRAVPDPTILYTVDEVVEAQETLLKHNRTLMVEVVDQMIDVLLAAAQQADR